MNPGRNTREKHITELLQIVENVDAKKPEDESELRSADASARFHETVPRSIIHREKLCNDVRPNPNCAAKVLALETRGKPQKIASRRRNRVSRKKSAEINHVQTVIEVLSVGLKAHGEPVALVQICANGRIDGK